MNTFSRNGAALAALAALSWSAVASPAWADPKDFEFQLVPSPLKAGDDAVITVRLMHKATGKPVPDAVIFARRIDMAPDGMPTMTAELQPAPAAEPGTYRFKVNLPMEGAWQLSLAAKLQGESGTLQNRLTLKVTE